MPGAAVADAILTSGRMNMDDVFSPEAVYASWMNMSYFALTTGMLFFHLTRQKSITVNKHFAAFTAVALLVISVFYILVAIVPYKSRLDRALGECMKSDYCDMKRAHEIHRVEQVNVWMGWAAIVVNLVICYMIFNTI